MPNLSKAFLSLLTYESGITYSFTKYMQVGMYLLGPGQNSSDEVPKNGHGNILHKTYSCVSISTIVVSSTYCRLLEIGTTFPLVQSNNCIWENYTDWGQAEYILYFLTCTHSLMLTLINCSMHSDNRRSTILAELLIIANLRSQYPELSTSASAVRFSYLTVSRRLALLNSYFSIADLALLDQIFHISVEDYGCNRTILKYKFGHRPHKELLQSAALVTGNHLHAIPHFNSGGNHNIFRKQFLTALIPYLSYTKMLVHTNQERFTSYGVAVSDQVLWVTCNLAVDSIAVYQLSKAAGAQKLVIFTRIHIIIIMKWSFEILQWQCRFLPRFGGMSNHVSKAAGAQRFEILLILNCQLLNTIIIMINW